MRRSVSPALLVLFALGIETGHAQAPPQRILIHAGRLIDGLTNQPRTDQGIEVADGRITAVGPWAELSARPGTRQRELQRVRFVMKGGVVYSALMNGYR
jgi:imidazolonepropionase-like amidohydrolase